MEQVTRIQKYFESFGDPYLYLQDNPFHHLLGITDVNVQDVSQKMKFDKDYKVSQPNIPLMAELDDLVRLHAVARWRKATTILEFGVGKSTAVLSDALSKNSKEYGSFVSNTLRRGNAFQLHCVDAEKKWIELNKTTYQLDNVQYHCSDVHLKVLCDRVCSLYDALPPISPDLIYIDGPDPYSVKGDINGFHTRHLDGMPMSGDVLLIENFLHPGTLIILDGRTANARFLKENFQREWEYTYIKKFDQHFFELIEAPLGVYNERHLDFISK